MTANPWWHYQLGRLCAMFRRYDRAVEELQQVLRIDPAHDRAVSLLAFVYAALGRRDLAIGQFKRALEIRPDDPILLFDLGYVLHLQKDYVAAIEAFERATRLNPKIDRAWYGMGLALGSLGRHEESADALGRRKKLDEVIAHLDRFDPKLTQHLVRATSEPGAPASETG
jgi:tetratricopeptide (TPR) repeat protein